MERSVIILPLYVATVISYGWCGFAPTSYVVLDIKLSSFEPSYVV
jgi:hypothetical protein